MLQGHVRIGPETVTDPAFLVTRSMEDFVTWVDTSKIKRKVQKYNEVCTAFAVVQTQAVVCYDESGSAYCRAIMMSALSGRRRSTTMTCCNEDATQCS